MTARKARTPAWSPATYEASDVEAVRAVYEGKADPAQQRRALDWVVNRASDTYEEPFRSDADGGERETSFALGRAYVGRQIVKLTKMSPALIATLRKTNG